MPQPRHKRSEQLERRQRVMRLRLRGLTLQQIAAEVGVHFSTVSRDIAAIETEWRKSAIVDFAKARAIALAKIEDLFAEAWRAWDRSTLDKDTKTVETGPNGDAQKTQLRREGRVGNPAFMDKIAWCIAKEMELRGVDGPPPVPADAGQLAAQVQAMAASVTAPGGEESACPASP